MSWTISGPKPARCSMPQVPARARSGRNWRAAFHRTWRFDAVSSRFRNPSSTRCDQKSDASETSWRPAREARRLKAASTAIWAPSRPGPPSRTRTDAPRFDATYHGSKLSPRRSKPGRPRVLRLSRKETKVSGPRARGRLPTLVCKPFSISAGEFANAGGRPRRGALRSRGSAPGWRPRPCSCSHVVALVTRIATLDTPVLAEAGAQLRKRSVLAAISPEKIGATNAARPRPDSWRALHGTGSAQPAERRRAPARRARRNRHRSDARTSSTRPAGTSGACCLCGAGPPTPRVPEIEQDDPLFDALVEALLGHLHDRRRHLGLHDEYEPPAA